MAKIYPERLPESVLQYPGRAAECKVYTALASLSSAYLVFYSVAWQARCPGWGAQDGEADFVVVHPQRGVLVLEVKGGGIAYDASLDQWYSTDRKGKKNPIKDPIEQARQGHHTLYDKLCDLPGWDRERYLNIGHAVAFPDILADSRLIRPDLPFEIVLDIASLTDLDAALSNAFSYYAGGRGGAGAPDSDRAAMIESLLARSFHITTPLGIELGYEDERLIELTEQQMVVLDLLGARRSAAIKGCAGSGKTMLAVEKARRLAGQGFQVLLTCFNAPLADDIAQRVPPNVMVMHFHALCKAMALEANIPLGPNKSATFYDEVLPDALLKAIDQLGPQHDAVIVDEGQDFKDNWWIGLASLLRSPDGIFFIFYDDNQNLYRGCNDIANVIGEEPFQLLDNCRNTQKIHQVVSHFHHAGGTLRSKGPLGRPPEIVYCKGEKECLHCLQGLLHRLVNQERIHNTNLIILTPRSADRTALTHGLRLGNFTIVHHPPDRPNQIQVSSVHRFKGLERQVVLMAELDADSGPHLDNLLYVGCSRARTHLILLVDESIPEENKSKILTKTL